MQSCWNGIAVMDPAPFYTPPHVKFRMARITEGECSASECSLIANDYWEAGYGRILMVPRVKLAYDGVRPMPCQVHRPITDLAEHIIREYTTSYIPHGRISRQYEGTSASAACLTTRARIRKTARGSDPTTAYSQTRRAS